MSHRTSRRKVRNLRLETLGDARLSGSGGFKLAPGKPLALLTYLALGSERGVHRHQLVDLLWSESSCRSGDHALRQAVWSLRRKLGNAAIVNRSGIIRLESPVDVDYLEFLDAIERHDLEGAVALYGGDFFPDFLIPGESEFERWAERQRRRACTLFLEAATSLVEDQLDRGDFRVALETASRVRDAAPTSQVAWNQVLECLLAIGDPMPAAVEAQAFEAQLREFGLQGTERSQQLLSAARTLRTSKREAEPGYPLVGRREELRDIAEQWSAAQDREARCVLVEGRGGMGKTRLFQAAAARLHSSGARVITMQLPRGDASIPYSALATLVEKAVAFSGSMGVSPATAQALVSLSPQLSSVYSAPPDPATGGEALRRRSLAVAELLAAIGHEEPIAIFIDDLQWADPETKKALCSALCRNQSLGWMVVISIRMGDDEETLPVIAHRVTLRPLTGEQVGALMDLMARRPSGSTWRSLPGSIVEATYGIPALVTETLNRLRSEGTLSVKNNTWSTGSHRALATRLRRGAALAHRLNSLDVSSSRIVVTLASRAVWSTDRELATALGYPLEVVVSNLASLERRGLVIGKGKRWTIASDEIRALLKELLIPEIGAAEHVPEGRAAKTQVSSRVLPLHSSVRQVRQA